MGQFLRFALLIILVFVGFGTGICGLFAVGATIFDTLNRSSGGADQFAGLAIVIGVVCIAVAVGCFFAVRALARGLRKNTTHAVSADSPPPDQPPPG